MHFEFIEATEQSFSFSKREGETRLWEEFSLGRPKPNDRFVIIGISEDHGPQFNKGLGGAQQGFQASIERLGHMQSNAFLSGSGICVLGELQQRTPFSSHNNTVVELDEMVETLLDEYLLPHQQVIVLGGGHNNALPLLRYQAKQRQQVTCFNIDPHADLRETKERHSGNPFSFALEEGILKMYHVIGLHESYNNQYILKQFEQEALSFQTFETYLDAPIDFLQVLNDKLNSTESDIQLDIDLDSIPFMPASAWTPSGFSLDQVRSLLRFISRAKNVHTLHLPEGAPKTEDELKFYSKSMAYLISDFIKTQY